MERGTFLFGRRMMMSMLGLFLTALVLHAGSPPFALPRQYVAEIQTNAGGQNSLMKVYADGIKSRMEMNTQGMDLIIITRADLKKAYSLMVAQKQYMEIPLDERQARQADPAFADPEAQWESLGTETVSGQLCNKYRVTAPNPEDPSKPVISLFYFNAQTNAPVRVVSSNRSEEVVVDFKSFKAETPDAALFEIPSGYAKFGMPSVPGAPGSTPQMSIPLQSMPTE